MNIKSEINIIQKQLLTRLSVKTGSTMFTIIEAITRQAFATSSLTVSQKNATLAVKCKVTASTISRNLRKLKDKCADLITIEQNRNVEEKFASLVFRFIIGKCQTVTSNGEQTEPFNDTNVSYNVAEIPTSNSSTESLIYISNPNKYLVQSNVKQDVDQDKVIFDTYIEFKEQGIDKTLFNKVLSQVQKNKGVRNFRKYLTGALKKVVGYKKVHDLMDFYDELEETSIKANTNKIPYYDWLNN